MLYVDFRKALDSIYRGMMMKILKANDILTRFLAAINIMYQKTRELCVERNENRTTSV